MRAQSRLTAALLAGLILTFCILAGADRRGTEQGQDDTMLLGILRNSGVKDDTRSLLDAAVSNPSATIRWVAIEILGQRKEQGSRTALLSIMGKDPDRLVRETAALALARLGDKTGFSALQDFMNTSSDAERQLFLAKSLAELGDPSGYKYVVAASQSKLVGLRASSAEALVAFLAFHEEIPTPATLFLKLADDSSPDVRGKFLTQLPMAVLKGVRKDIALPIVEHLEQQDSEPVIRQSAGSLLKAWNLEQELRRKPGGHR
jgi:hypothetical protein